MTKAKAETPAATELKVQPSTEPEVKNLREDLAIANDKLLRALAEAENVRRRAERDVREASGYAIVAFAKDMISVLDNLQRALKAIPENLKSDPQFCLFIEGLTLTERQFLLVLEQHGVTKISPKGEVFDHNFHQALFEVETSVHPAGHIAEVVQEGYLIKDRLLRAALVGVAKSPKSSVPEDNLNSQKS